MGKEKMHKNVQKRAKSDQKNTKKRKKCALFGKNAQLLRIFLHPPLAKKKILSSKS